MQIQTVVKKYLVPAVACLTMMVAARSMHAQNIGAGNLTLSFDNQEVLNGYPNENGSTVYPPVGQMTGVVTVNGVTGNRGTTYVICYDSIAGNVFTWSTQVSGQGRFYLTPAVGSHTMYCTADYTGYYANGNVTTGTLSFTVQ